MTIPKSIDAVVADANELKTDLSADLDFNIDVPDIVIDTDIPMPPTDGPAFEPVEKITLESLTTNDINGTGVFDVLMRSVSAQLESQFEKGRIQGGDYAKAYIASVEVALQQGINFLMTNERTHWETLRAQTEAQIALAQRSRAIADVKLAQAQLQIAQYEGVRIKLSVYTAKNEYAISKMALVTSYNQIVLSENQNKLVGEQYEAARAQTMETRSDGTLIAGIFGIDKMVKEAQLMLSNEQVDTARAQTKDTLQNGGQILGVVAEQKKLVQAQVKMVSEQVEGARGQVRGTLSTGEPVVGLIGAQVKLYDQQRISYQRDAETKYTKMLLDTWTARKTIDEGVAVPSIIDTAAINTSMTTLKTNLQL